MIAVGLKDLKLENGLLRLKAILDFETAFSWDEFRIVLLLKVLI